MLTCQRSLWVTWAVEVTYSRVVNAWTAGLGKWLHCCNVVNKIPCYFTRPSSRPGSSGFSSSPAFCFSETRSMEKSYACTSPWTERLFVKAEVLVSVWSHGWLCNTFLMRWFVLWSESMQNWQIRRVRKVTFISETRGGRSSTKSPLSSVGNIYSSTILSTV